MDWFRALIVIFLRSLLLWVVIPITFLIWLVVFPGLDRRGVTLDQLLGWVDFNLIVLMQRSLGYVGSDWVPVRRMGDVTHRMD